MLGFWLGFALLCSAHAYPGSRIVDGEDAKPGEIPYIVSLRVRNGDHRCGASILNEYWILTAAHCIKGWNATRLLIQYGVTHISSNGINTLPINKIIQHPDYVPGNGYLNDVALLKLTQPITFSDLAQPVALPPAFNATPGGAEAVLAGWGYQETAGVLQYDLQRVNINVYTDEDCEYLHALTGPTNRRYHVCAGVVEGGKGQCNGDSGGPLVVNGTQVGIVSWSVKPCAIAPYPGVFAKVANYVEWIYKQIAEDEKIRIIDGGITV